ncbi:hypothetical protein KKF38_03050 [Patescibacteria group bacterium]|nr:hypothetical protein [Patescibacteria group bacterium]
MNNPNNSSQPFYFKIVLGSAFAVIVFMLFALARSTYRDLFQVGSYIEASVASIEEQKEDLAAKPSELAYAESPRYREKIAKELLGRKLPGEEVIILTDETQTFADFLPSQTQTKKNYELLSPPQKWLRYVFGI